MNKFEYRVVIVQDSYFIFKAFLSEEGNVLGIEDKPQVFFAKTLPEMEKLVVAAREAMDKIPLIVCSDNRLRQIDSEDLVDEYRELLLQKQSEFLLTQGN